MSKRLKLSSSINLLLIISIFSLISSLTSAENWSMFLKNYSNIPLSSNSIPDEVDIIWEAEIGGESYSSPTIVDGKLYIGSGNEYLYCFDAELGTLLWEFQSATESQSDFGLCSTPCVENGKVYFGSSDFYAYCLDAKNGIEIWSRYLIDETHPDANYGACASPIVYNGKVYFGTDSYEHENDQNQDAPNLYCLDALGNGDGTTDVIWSYSSPLDGFFYSTPAFKGNKLVTGTWANTGEVICLDTEGNGDGTTNQYWKFSMPSQTMASPTIDGNTVYIGDGAFTVDRPTFNVYAIDLNSAGDLVPLSEEWHYTGQDHFVSSAVPYNSKIYVADLGGTVHCINTDVGIGKTASADWTFETNHEIWATPTIAKGRLIIGNFNGDLYCLDTQTSSSTEREIWKIHLSDAEIYTSATLVNDRIYISTNDGKLFCLGDKSTVINQPAKLTGIEVTPENANEDDMITFSVLYTDLENDQPLYVQVIIDDVTFSMAPVTSGFDFEYDQDYTNGERYEYQTQFYAGEHIYNFKTNDGTNVINSDIYILDVDEGTNGNDDGNSNGDGSDGGDNDGDGNSGSSDSSGTTPGFDINIFLTATLLCLIIYKWRPKTLIEIR